MKFLLFLLMLFVAIPVTCYAASYDVSYEDAVQSAEPDSQSLDIDEFRHEHDFYILLPVTLMDKKVEGRKGRLDNTPRKFWRPPIGDLPANAETASR